jgi:hypothetical protein
VRRQAVLLVDIEWSGCASSGTGMTAKKGLDPPDRRERCFFWRRVNPLPLE